MSSSHLRLRENWQTLSGNLAAVAERDFADVFQKLLINTDYVLNTRPKDFANIYYDYPLLAEDKEQIYDPQVEYRHGFFFLISPLPTQ